MHTKFFLLTWFCLACVAFTSPLSAQIKAKSARASSEETDKDNFAKKAIDGDLDTRWCAAGGGGGQWLEIDLGEPQAVGIVRLHWEQDDSAYKYKLEASGDAQQWNLLVDASSNQKKQRIVTHRFEPQALRFLRVTFEASSAGGWGSLWEVEAAEKNLPKVPENRRKSSSPLPTLADVKAPPEFDVRIFAGPPEVNYPVCLTAAPTGELFIGIDEQGSLGKEPGRGRIVRAIDTNGDGVADKFNDFAKIDHPRGLIYDQGHLWVLHPPTLSLLIDKDGDGVSDEQKTLLSNISTDQVNERGADHTTNGIRMGIDGWIYIAVGDFGFLNATGTDGRSLSRRGGGIVRVRPDGTDTEVYSWGQRNILDVCIDPQLNMFTRDNTNDGGGWNVRVTHILQGAHYGYPSKYINFAEEIMPPLADHGGGSGCGAMYVYDPRWPQQFGNAYYTCDWGTSQVYRHQASANGPTFEPNQDVFVTIPRPTDIDIDGSGRLFVSSWKNGGFNFSDPNVGFVAMLAPKELKQESFPDVTKLSVDQLSGLMSTGNAVHTLHVQREFIRRASGGDRTNVLEKLWHDVNWVKAPLSSRIAALFTIKQIEGVEANARLVELAQKDAELREFALRAMTDRLGEMQGVPTGLFRDMLRDENPRVQVAALIGLSRLAQAGAIDDTQATALSILNAVGSFRSAESQVAHDSADPARVIPHLAIRALRDLKVGKLLVTLIGSEQSDLSLLAMREMHDVAVVDGLIGRLQNQVRDPKELTTVELLARLYFREGDYTRGDWWGTRPDTTGPYYDRARWDGTSKISDALESVWQAAKSDEDQAKLSTIFKRYRLPLAGAAGPTAENEPEMAVVAKAADPNNPNQIGNLQYEAVLSRAVEAAGRVRRGQRLFKSHGCSACHTDATGQTPKGPHLVDIGKRYKRPELIESIIKPSAKLAQGFDSWAVLTSEGKTVMGFVVLESAETLTLRQANGLSVELPKDEVESRKKQEASMMPQGLVDSLTPEELADLLAYLQSLK